MAELLTFLAAIPAGVGGCLLGVRVADWVNRKLGRTAPDEDEPETRSSR